MLTTYRRIEKVSSQFHGVARERLQWQNPLPNPLALGAIGQPLTERYINRVLGQWSKRFDLLHATDPFHFPPNIRNSAVTIHDLIPLYREKWVSASMRRRIHRKITAITRSSAIIFVPSHFVRMELLEHFTIAPERIHVTHEASGEAFHPMKVSEVDLTKFGLTQEDEFFLYVGRIDIRKNIDRLVEAYVKLPAELRHSVKLVLIANGSPKHQEKFRARFLHHEGILHLTSVSDQDLARLLNRALALAFVSLSEGFGIPVLEAMQSGCPVLTSNMSSMPEIAGDAAMLIDPYDVEAIKSGLLRLATDSTLRRDLSNRGIERAKEFSWERCARETHAGYEAALRH
jgi:glycosyltransferase involved in cell wall biosynthesis